jgi:type IV pilus assembly protein PilM
MGGVDMLGFLKNRTYSIGVDMGRDTLKLVQLREDGDHISVVAGGSENRPEKVKPGSGNWQRWVIETIRKLTANSKFRGRDVIAAMPASELFIDHIRMPKVDNDKLQDAICSKIKPKLPFEPDDAMIKYIPTEGDNVLVIASERKIIDRYLAVYEKAGLTIKSIAVWPVALMNSYTKFFARRKADVQTVAILLDIEANCTNVVICRHKTLLYARSIPIGAKQLDGDEIVARLVLELTSCRQHFASLYPKTRIERLIFLSGQAVDKDVCATVAKQLEMPAQMADCMAAVKMPNPNHSGKDPECQEERLGLPIDRRNCRVNWATAFGLSLS